jgi:hypothetical protein
MPLLKRLWQGLEVLPLEVRGGVLREALEIR